VSLFHPNQQKSLKSILAIYTAILPFIDKKVKKRFSSVVAIVYFSECLSRNV